MKANEINLHIADIINTRDNECIKIIDEVSAIIKSAPPHEAEKFRLMGVSLLYSMWERIFTLSTSIAIKIIRSSHQTARSCPPPARALWLRKAPFYQSHITILRDILELDREDGNQEKNEKMRGKIKKGTYNGALKIIQDIEEWHKKPLDAAIDAESLVMTYANVNPSVTQLNAEAIGITAIPSYSTISLSRLDELLGYRNGIAHGAIITAPGEKTYHELTDYTKLLIQSYAQCIIDWIEKTNNEINPTFHISMYKTSKSTRQPHRRKRPS